ncbi:MAG: hypothetical protein LC114_14550 [Bryobacterales bacterium]|nr:hypothetical protein [Bryobacterales bacterium]
MSTITLGISHAQFSDWYAAQGRDWSVTEMLLSSHRTVSRILAVVTMFLAAYSVYIWMGTSVTISGWIGLEKHQSEIPLLQKRAQGWLFMAVCLPLVSALLLGLGVRRDASADVHQAGKRFRPADLLSGLAVYGRWLMIAVLGALGFAVLLFSIGWILYALRPHA